MTLPLRAVVEVILYGVVTGCQSTNLPGEYPNPKSVFYHVRKGCRDGTWQRINRARVWLERRRVRRWARPSGGVVDSQSAKTVTNGEQRGYDGHKQVKGRKRHLMTDTLGNLLEVVVLAANRPDSAGVYALLTKVGRTVSLRLRKLWAHKGYQGEDVRTWLQDEFQIDLEIVTAEPDQVGFVVQPRRPVVERSFAGLGQYRRLSKDYERCPLSSEGMIYLASIRTLLKRLPD